MSLLLRSVPVLLTTPAFLLAQAAPEGDPPDDKTPDSLLELLVMGGEMMIPILICSVIALTVTIERLINLQRSKVIPQNFAKDLHQALGEDKTNLNIEEGVKFCERSETVMAHIFKPAIQKIEHGEEVIQKTIEDAGMREIGRLKRRLRPLSSIATISPLLGLLGTVYGMIEAFQAASGAGHGKSDVLAEGIYVALVTTAAGLTLAIPVLIIHQLLSGKVDALVDEIDVSATEFLDAHSLHNKS